MTIDGTPDGTNPRLPDEVVEDILEADRRRIALEILDEREDPVVIDDLAAAVRARELDTDPESVPTEERREIRDEFFADHLPKLTATEVVSYNSLLGTLTLADDQRVTEAL